MGHGSRSPGVPTVVWKCLSIMFSMLSVVFRPVVLSPPFLSSLRALHPQAEKVSDLNPLFPLENSRTPSHGTQMSPQVCLEGPPWSRPPRPVGRSPPPVPSLTLRLPLCLQDPLRFPLPWDILVHIPSVENPAPEPCSC